MKKTFSIFLFLFMLPLAIYAQNKVALVVGNNEYDGFFSKLITPKNDAKEIGKLFHALGYDTIVAYNLDRESMSNYLKRLKKKSSGAKEVVFYFSGHACWKGNDYYLVPSGEYEYRASIEADCYPFNSVENIMAGINSSLKIIFVDACQNSLDGNKAPTKKRNPAEISRNSKSAEGLISFFATDIGKTAKSGKKFSVFTEILLNHLYDYGTFNKIWKIICKEVLSISPDQTPTYRESNNGLINKIEFNPEKKNLDLFMQGKGKVNFIVFPKNAVVKIGRDTYRNGENAILNLGEKYSYTVSATGHESYDGSFTLTEDKYTIEHTLIKIEPATLLINSNVETATIVFNGVSHENCSMPYKLNTQSGKHEVVLKKRGYYSNYKTIKLKPGDNECTSNIYRRVPPFFEWDPDKMINANYYYNPKFQIGLTGMYRFNNSRFSVGATIATSIGFYRGWNDLDIQVSQNMEITTDITIDKGNGELVGAVVTKKIEYDEGNDEYSSFIDPYNEAKRYDANLLFLGNVGYNICNGIMLETGLGFSCHQKRYHMPEIYQITTTTVTDKFTGEMIGEQQYEYEGLGKSKWFKGEYKWSPAARLGAKILIPLDRYEDFSITIGGGYTYMPLLNEFSSWDAMAGFCCYF